ncbi:MAG: recombinase RecA [Peptostreptococcaceae bacterium]|nr:recombinase RecA [Peptostreptococcaceae bacterium]
MASSKKTIKREEVVDKKKALEKALAEIQKGFGKGSIMILGENTKMNVESISTGSVGLDKAIGIGGLPKGRIVEIYGAESSGKTTIALHCIAEAQKVGGNVAFIDAEHALDPVYAKALGVDINSLLISQPDTGEQALDIADTLVRSGAMDLIVIDSVAALVPKAEIEGEMGDTFIGLQARLMSQALRKLAGHINWSKTIVIFINQLRSTVNTGYGGGPTETTAGGRALKFYATVRLEVKRIGQLKQGENVVGNRTKIKVVKNKVSPPFKVCEFDIMYGKGISKVGELLDVAIATNIIKQSGSWFSFGDRKLGQGRENIKIMIEENEELFEEIKEKVMQLDSLPDPEDIDELDDGVKSIDLDDIEDEEFDDEDFEEDIQE